MIDIGKLDAFFVGRDVVAIDEVESSVSSVAPISSNENGQH